MRLNRDLAVVRNRKSEADDMVLQSVREILANVRAEGDIALRRYAQKFDGFIGQSLFVGQDEINAAVQNTGGDFMRVLARAAEQIREFHTHQKEKSWAVYKDNGVVLGQMQRPLRRVALYVPGGTAAYPSSVLMSAIPALIAGVSDILLLTPAKADGKVADVILAAAACCGVPSICKVGGAHGVAAAAYGTESIQKADKIVGPGNLYVATAKKLVYGETDIDMIAGPSEILIIADDSANPVYIAADMLSQAEHDELASAILVSTSERIIVETEREIERQMAGLSRRAIMEKSLAQYGAAVCVESLEKAFEVSNDIAPEHLEILTANPMEKLPMAQNAGSIFLGEYTPEPLGDYMSGTNHVLPTGGAARFSSPLGVYDFVKWSAYSYYPRAALAELKDDVMLFAQKEGLTAHANSVKVRYGG